MVDGVPEYSYYESVEQPSSEVEQPENGGEFNPPEYEEGVTYPLDPNDPAAMPEDPGPPGVINPWPFVPPHRENDPPPPLPPIEHDPDWVDGP